MTKPFISGKHRTVFRKSNTTALPSNEKAWHLPNHQFIKWFTDAQNHLRTRGPVKRHILLHTEVPLVALNVTPPHATGKVNDTYTATKMHSSHFYTVLTGTGPYVNLEYYREYSFLTPDPSVSAYTHKAHQIPPRKGFSISSQTTDSLPCLQMLPRWIGLLGYTQDTKTFRLLQAYSCSHES